MADIDELLEVVIDPVNANRDRDGVNPITRSITKQFSRSHPEPNVKQETSHTIVRVHNPTLRQIGDLDPEFIWIGPLHRLQKPALPVDVKRKSKSIGQLQPRRKPALHMDVKRKYLKSLLCRDEANKLEKFVQQVNELEHDARKHYPDDFSELSKDEFVEMMVVDGCFVVEFLVRHWLGEAQEEVVRRNEPKLKRDLLRLENQIPFCVLQSIFQSCVIPWIQQRYSLTTIALNVLAEGCTEKGRQPVHHLLHLLHLSMDDFSGDPKRSFSLIFYPFSRILNLLVRYTSKCFSCFAYGCVRCFVPDSKSNDYERSKPPGCIPTATYLRDHGFKFALKEGRSSLDIRIRGTTIEIPVFRLSGYNLSLLRNLLAFEKYCSLTEKRHVTRYGTFMANLIRTREDVEILQESGIIGTFPGSVDKVLNYFENICRGERLDRDKHHLTPQVEKIDEHFEKNYHRVQLYKWRKKLIPDYFSNPWAVPSMVAAFILLVLTVVQTFFAVYSYYRPPSSAN